MGNTAEQIRQVRRVTYAGMAVNVAIAAANAMFDFVEGPGGWKAWREAHDRKVKELKS